MRSFADDDKPARYAHRDVCAIRETTNAVLVRFPNGREQWIPKSQLDDDSEVYAQGHVGKLVVSTWYAEKVGLPDETASRS